MNNLELEFKKWMSDFEAHESFRTVRNAPLKCMPNEFVFYYDANSLIAETVGKFLITNKRVAFDIPTHGITDIPLSDIDVNYIDPDGIEITQGTASIHVGWRFPNFFLAGETTPHRARLSSCRFRITGQESVASPA